MHVCMQSVVVKEQASHEAIQFLATFLSFRLGLVQLYNINMPECREPRADKVLRVCPDSPVLPDSRALMVSEGAPSCQRVVPHHVRLVFNACKLSGTAV